jgi:penicillin-binding protein 1A
MKLFLRFLGWVFAGGTIVFCAGATAVAGLLWHFSKELPDYSQLQN